MSVKKQIPSLCKLYSFYEEIPEEFLDKTDVDSYFNHNNFDNSQSEHRIVRVSRGSNKKSLATKLFQFCDLKTQQRYIVQEKVNISKRELTCLVVQIQCVQVGYACTKRLSNLLAEAIINVRNVGLCARCAKFLLKNKQIPSSCRSVRGFTFLKRAQNQFKMLLEMSIVLASIVSTERNANLLVVM